MNVTKTGKKDDPSQSCLPKKHLQTSTKILEQCAKHLSFNSETHKTSHFKCELLF